jgi:hypothetical protein
MEASLDMMQGLDPGRYRSTTITEAEEHRFSALDSQLPDSERYKDAASFVVRCHACECSVGFAPVANMAVRLSLRSISALGSSRHIVGVVGQGQRSYVSHVRQKPWDSELADPARTPDPGAHSQILRGLDRL